MEINSKNWGAAWWGRGVSIGCISNFSLCISVGKSFSALNWIQFESVAPAEKLPARRSFWRPARRQFNQLNNCLRGGHSDGQRGGCSRLLSYSALWAACYYQMALFGLPVTYQMPSWLKFTPSSYHYLRTLTVHKHLKATFDTCTCTTVCTNVLWWS